MFYELHIIAPISYPTSTLPSFTPPAQMGFVWEEILVY
jgi:hypothetical protein